MQVTIIPHLMKLGFSVMGVTTTVIMVDSFLIGIPKFWLIMEIVYLLWPILLSKELAFL